jgi:hypothetical protein
MMGGGIRRKESVVPFPPPNTFGVSLTISSAQGESGLSLRLLPFATLRLIPASKIRLRRTVSQSVAAIWRKARANLSGQFQGDSKRFKVIQTKKRENSSKIYEPFVPSRGHSVIVNPRNRFGFRTVKPMSRFDSRHFVCKYFTMNDLHNNQPSGESRSVKPGQTDPRMPNALPSLCSFAAIPCGGGASRVGSIRWVHPCPSVVKILSHCSLTKP